MDVINLKEYTEYGQRSGRRPHFLQAVAFADSVASRTETLVRQRHANRPGTIAKLIGLSWEEVIIPELTNGQAPLVRDPEVVRAITEILSDHWVYGDLFAQISTELAPSHSDR